MTTQTVYTRSIKTVIFGFLGFTAAAAALAVAQKAGIVEAAVVKRALGLIIGVMIVVTGNFLPKIRPLNAPGVNPAKAAAIAERFAGWILVLVGIAYVGLFAFAPLERARTISATLGIGAMVLIAANWAWLVRGALLGGRAEISEETPDERTQAARKRKLIVPLLFAFFYCLVTACVVFLVQDRHQIKEVSWWMFLGFWLVYAALTVILECKPQEKLGPVSDHRKKGVCAL